MTEAAVWRSGWRPPIWLRPVMAGVLGLGLLLVALGIVEDRLFSQQSATKYGLTVAAALVTSVAVLADRPLRWLVPPLIVAAPFASFVVSVKGIAISAVVPLLALGVGAAVLKGTAGPRPSRLAKATPWAFVLLAWPLLTGKSVSRELTLVASFTTVAWLTSRVCDTAEGRNLVLDAITFSAVVQASLAIYEFKTGHRLTLYGSAGTDSSFGPDYFFGYESEKRPPGAFSDPIALGNVLAVALPLMFTHVLLSRGLRRALCVVACPIVLVGLDLSLSRMSWVGAAAGLVVSVVLAPKGKRLVAGVVLTVLAAATITYAVATAGAALVQRFDSIAHPTSAGVSTAQGDKTRLLLWSAAEGVFEHHLLTGVGVNRLQPELVKTVAGTGPTTHAHSTYLQIASEAGLLGIVGFLLLGRGIASDLALARRLKAPQTGAVAGALVALLIGWSTDYTIRNLTVACAMAPLLGLVCALSSEPRSTVGS